MPFPDSVPRLYSHFAICSPLLAHMAEARGLGTPAIKHLLGISAGSFPDTFPLAKAQLDSCPPP